MIKLVVDASILVAAVVADPESPPGLVLTAARAGQLEMVACPHLLEEVERALRRPYFARRVSEERRTAILEMFRALASMAEDPVDPPAVLRDAGDDYLVALALKSGAEAIVTGDKDLLDHPDLRPEALTARAACQRLGLLSR